MKPYIICESSARDTPNDALSNLEEKVNILINQGYIPTGGVSIYKYKDELIGEENTYLGTIKMFICTQAVYKPSAILM